MSLRIFGRYEKLGGVLVRNLSKSASGNQLKLQVLLFVSIRTLCMCIVTYSWAFTVFGLMMTFGLASSEEVFSHELFGSLV